ncbi:UNVERIFIED_CONTAM: hypothetical protein HDU68_003573, partial [Siphonaria sp. JEL0065]
LQFVICTRQAEPLLISLMGFGKWNFPIGLPTKSGVSGAISVVVPNVGSPKVDTLGNFEAVE